MAAIREVAEEAGVNVAERYLQKVAVLNFLFPAKPEWSQLVHVFLATTWSGEPTESVEMKPVWYPITTLPFAAMWQDASHWLPLILAKKSIQATFTFADDNETVATATLQTLLTHEFGQLKTIVTLAGELLDLDCRTTMNNMNCREISSKLPILFPGHWALNYVDEKTP